ncbi:MAG: DUF2062 domain-containing protein [bacterium]
MPRDLFKRVVPERHVIHEHRFLKHFGELLHDGNLWHLNRHSVSGAMAVGLFCAMLPIPFQTVLAAAMAIFFRVNLPLSVMLVWLTNPVTIPPVFYLAYLIGTAIVPGWALESEFHLSMEWMLESTAELFAPTMLGGIIMGGISALLGYFGMQLFWRWLVVVRYRRRKHSRDGTKENLS